MFDPSIRYYSSSTPESSCSSSSSTSPCPTRPSSPTSTANDCNTNGQVLRSDYVYEGITYGTQTIQRTATIPQMIAQLEARFQYLTSLRGQDELSEKIRLAELNEIEQQLCSCFNALQGNAHIPQEVLDEKRRLEESLHECLKTNDKLTSNSLARAVQSKCDALEHYKQECKFDWLGSNYVRDCLSLAEGIDSPDTDTALAAYHQSAKGIIPAAINLRRHEISAGGDPLTLIRTGVISDMRDGYHSLEDLVAFQKGGERALQWQYNLLNQQCCKLYQKKGRSTPELAALGYARDCLRSKEDLAIAIAKRRSFLQHQMLMLVMEHLQTAIAKGELAESLPMVHLSLLNRKTNSSDEATGWKKNEETFMRNMAYIFKEFNGKEIVFDGTGPLIDNEGTIHLPKEYGVTGKKITLDTYFMNISVQNHKVNDGVQSQINDQFFEKLKSSPYKAISKSLERQEKLLNKGHSSFGIAEDAALALLNNNFYVSIGCLSAKDRTGWLCGRIGVRHILKTQCSLMTHQERECREEKWSAEIFTGPAFEVCKDCNLRALEPLHVSALKLTEVNLRGIGIATRANQLTKLISMAVNPSSSKAKRQKISPPPRRRRSRTPIPMEIVKIGGKENVQIHAQSLAEPQKPPVQLQHQAAQTEVIRPSKPPLVRRNGSAGLHRLLPTPAQVSPIQPAQDRKVKTLISHFETLADQNKPR